MPRAFSILRRRKRLIAENGICCHYCTRETDEAVKTLFPVVEHFIPRHMEKQVGEKKLVLACNWCDKTKGMLTGPEYIAIVQEFLARYPRFEVAQMYISRKCKALNRDRHRAYFTANPNIHENCPLTTASDCATADT